MFCACAVRLHTIQIRKVNICLIVKSPVVKVILCKSQKSTVDTILIGCRQLLAGNVLRRRTRAGTRRGGKPQGSVWAVCVVWCVCRIVSTVSGWPYKLLR